MNVRLFLLSFLILFLELTLIRWIPANMVLVGYFANLMLLGSFLGIGCGVLLARKSFTLFQFFPLTLLFLIISVSFLKFDIDFPSEEALFFTPRPVLPTLPPEILLPFLFLGVAITFSTLSQELGRLFNRFKPITAYSIDILGSILGIVFFTSLSFLGTPAFVWFLIIVLLFLYLLPKSNNSRFFIQLLLLSAIFFIPLFINFGSFWSPYYKITLEKKNTGYLVNANNTAHQFITTYQNKLPFYFAPYQGWVLNDYKRVLIIGAGTGSDVAVALAKGSAIQRIDAVEIDPTLAYIGKKLHPDKPYQNPKVHLYIDDGRNFLERNNEKYDLIIFAITDSLTLTGNLANVRLETFLYTLEAFYSVKNHLSNNGLFVIYNYFPQSWAFDKVAFMLEKTFGFPPYFSTYNNFGSLGVFMTGPKSRQLNSQQLFEPYVVEYPFPPAENDWPFLYLKDKKLPDRYVNVIILLSLLSTGAIFFAIGKKRSFDFRFFLFGAAFMLLEAKALVTFSLLFGNTWLVNSLVFTSILVSILIANLISSKITIGKPFVLYLVLIINLILQYIVPASVFSGLFPVFGYLASSVFYFSPIFFANLLFSQFFKKTTDSAVSFGSNVLGIVFGGLIEYFAIVTGYKAITILVLTLYLSSMINYKFKPKFL